MKIISDLIGRRFDDLRRIFRMRSFALFSIGNFSSLMAIWIIRVCVAWLTWEQTHSKTWLGIMAFAELGPSVLVSVWSGPLADRLDRVRILRWGQGTQTVMALMLVFLAAKGWLNVWWMLAAMLCFSVTAGLTLPARMSVAPMLVPRDQVATASAVSSISLNLTRLAGPSIGALFLVANLEPAAFALCAFGFALNAICLTRIRREQSGGAAAPKATGESYTYREVIVGVMADPRLSLVLVLQFVGSLLLRPFTDMFPAFADQVFNRGEHGFAALTAAVGAGAIVGAGAMIGGSGAVQMLRQVFFGTALFGLSGLVFTATTSFWLAVLVLAAFGALLTTSGVAGTSYVQLNTPANQLGRVMSIYSLIFRLGPAAGALCLGVASDMFGLKLASAGFALASLLALLVAWPAYRRAVAGLRP